MREMKDSGIEWIGEIPLNWETRKIKFTLTQRKESNNPIKSRDILSLTAKQGVVPYSEKDGVGGNKPKEDFSSYNLAYPKDIVMNSMNVISGSVGLSRYFGCVSPVYYMFYSTTNDIRFFNYYFQTSVFQRSLLGLGNGILMKESGNGKFNTVRMRIPMDKLGQEFVPVPPFCEQQKISDFLDKKCSEIDSLSADIQTQIDTLEEYKKSVITEAVTKGLNPNVEMKDSGIKLIGLMPSTWNTIKLKYLGNLQNGISKSGAYFGKGFPFVSYSDVYNNFTIPHNVSGLLESSISERIKYSVKKGDIFFTRTSETVEEVGLSSLCSTDIKDATFAGFLIRFRPTPKGKVLLNLNFAKYYFRSELLRFYFLNNILLVTRASLSQQLLEDLPVLLPAVDEQQQIADYLDQKCADIDKTISEKQQQLETLDGYKKSLIYEYVTGKKEIA